MLELLVTAVILCYFVANAGLKIQMSKQMSRKTRVHPDN